MKVYYVYGYPFFYLDSPEGPAVHINSTIRAFRDAGCEVIALVGSGYRKMAARSSTTLATPSFIGKIRKTLIDLAHLAYGIALYMRTARRVDQPAVIYERYSFFSWTGLALKHKWKIPYFVEFNDAGMETRNSYFGRSFLEPVANIIFRQILAEAAAIIAVSKPVASALVLRGASREKTFVIPNGVSPDLFNPDNYDRNAIRQKHGLRDSVVIGFVGGMVPWHGVNFLMEAAGEIVRVEPRAKFLIVGGGESSILQLGELARRNGLSDHVVCAGWVSHDEVPSYLAAMDIVTAPYAPMENGPIYFSPLKVFEYMAMGKPVVASRIDQLEELFEGGKEIFLIEPGNVPDLTSSILNLIRDPELAHEIGSNARGRVLSAYTWDKVAARILAIYGNLSNRP